ncbi:hypothetical protein [Dyadobacter sp. CY356]|uniref:hypothetical protein n=1 Tax=Dyadobacter sp. CY356 TaxID=2906442 RepID=UPI001F1A3225|nr:hypothetical protein [Dyadobacter sp. CY356]MCF0054495.1 hypothetical protein [Dyadobacter sp. CY356]
MHSYIWEAGTTGPAAKRRNNEIIKVEEFYTNALARDATQFIEKNKDKPFFCMFRSMCRTHLFRRRSKMWTIKRPKA